MSLNYYTQESFDKLKEKLNNLKNIERPSIARQIAEARDKGDLSENAEYAAAKDAQSLLETKISEIEENLGNSKIVDADKLDNSKVTLMSKVTILNINNNTEMVYTLVPENESNISEGKISINSPVSKGLLGKVEGDKVSINVPNGKMDFKVIKISK